ncbi:Uncharacterised protein [Mycobacteroides abscessus subsp. abscessus]|nr:Uncharacterised protein [Mycobacteroides abscessus subsp. abscessus]
MLKLLFLLFLVLNLKKLRNFWLMLVSKVSSVFLLFTYIFLKT